MKVRTKARGTSESRDRQGNGGQDGFLREESKGFKRSALVDSEALGLQMGRVEVTTNQPERLLSWAKKCPLCFNATMRIDHSNVTLYVVGEEQELFRSIVDEHIRRIEGVDEVSFSPIVRWLRPVYGDIDLQVERTIQPPCGMPPFCEKCPRNPDYDGIVWH